MNMSHSKHVSPTILAVSASFLGVASVAALAFMAHNDARRTIFLILMLTPFVAGFTGAFQRNRRPRIVCWWLAAGLCVIPAALTIFSGLAVLFVICLVFYLVSALIENEASNHND